LPVFGQHRPGLGFEAGQQAGQQGAFLRAEPPGQAPFAGIGKTGNRLMQRVPAFGQIDPRAAAVGILRQAVDQAALFQARDRAAGAAAIHRNAVGGLVDCRGPVAPEDLHHAPFAHIQPERPRVRALGVLADARAQGEEPGRQVAVEVDGFGGV